MPEWIGVIGAGSWGTALAYLLGQKGVPVWLWGRDPERIQALQREHVNRRYLPEVVLPDTVTSTADLHALTACEAWVLAVPSGAVRSVLNRLPYGASLCIIAAKGLEPDTGKRMSEVVLETGRWTPEQIAVLSGPNLAVELVRGVPTATVAAAYHLPTAETVQELFMTPTLRVYTNDDVVGVELGGALKNVYAIGAGMSDGLGFGDNTKGALLARGLAEMMRLGAALGACPETFMGLTGVGDLFATAASRLSRNYRLGYAVAQGKTPQQALQELGQVAEGYFTAFVAQRLAHQHGIDTPLLNAIAEILNGARSVSDALQSLMTRPPRGEREFRFVRT
ncbi:MAG: NAD(P)-dependent glycerol-3-phosphate dehydrogenase [Fimbriimonadales bacterium]|nr:NAD(P)-dependent glycerol-3-phosphate dehydrogenase [Fimbriimonadales bacterium]